MTYRYPFSKIYGQKISILLLIAANEIFCNLRDQCATHLESLRRSAEILADLDALASLARVARDNQYCRPQFSQDILLELEESRHPVLEKLHTEERFIPNDIKMDEKPVTSAGEILDYWESIGVAYTTDIVPPAPPESDTETSDNK